MLHLIGVAVGAFANSSFPQPEQLFSRGISILGLIFQTRCTSS